DILHSRVARSDLHVLRALGTREIRLCGPARLLPAAHEVGDAVVGTDFDAAVEGADVVIMLRLQKERMDAALVGGERDYFERYGLDAKRLRRAAADAL